MSDISSANYSLEKPYALSKFNRPGSMSANYILENHPAYVGADDAPMGTTTRLNKNQVAVKVQTVGTVFAASTTCTVAVTNVATSATGGGYISMNDVSCSIACHIWARSKTNLV